MPPWRGWNEQEVRGEIVSRQEPSTAGVPDVAAQHGSKKSARLRSSDRARKPSRNNQSVQSLVSQYLGRGEDLDAAESFRNASSRQTRATRSKKAASASKKRKRNAEGKSDTSSKRRRTSSVKDSLVVAKTDVDQSRSNGSTKQPPSVHATQRNPDSVKYPSISSEPSHDPTRKASKAPSTQKFVSIFAPTTTMNTLDSTSKRSSMEAVRASGGYGYISYSTSFEQPSQRDMHLDKPRAESCSNPDDDMSNNDDVLSSGIGDIERGRHINVSNPQARKRSLTPFQRQAPQCDTTPSSRAPSSETLGRSQRSTRFIRRHTAVIDTSGDEHDPIEPAGYESNAMTADKVYTSDEFEDQTLSSDTLPLKPDAGVIDNDYDSDASEDQALLAQTKVVEKAFDDARPRSRKQNIREVDEHDDYGGALLTATEREELAQLKAKAKARPIHIVRKSFPSPVQDRSPLFGISKSALLRTCFRVGEAFNAGTQAVRTQTNVMLELYARVVASWREPGTRKQHFVFNDLEACAMGLTNASI